MVRLSAVIEYRFVSPSMLAAGEDEEGRPVRLAEPVAPITVDAMAERQEGLVVALEIEVEMHRDTGVLANPMFHSAPNFGTCDCVSRLEHAKRKTRTDERTILAKVWLMGQPEDERDREVRS